MRVVSVQVGRPRTVLSKGRDVSTAIFKQPVTGRLMLRRLNLDGDEQADLTVHGGPEKAVYVYPVEHYPFWHAEYPEMGLPHGMFGENLTIEGLLENEVNVGDTFRIGGAEVVATQPRMPCYKLGIKFGRDDILKRFLRSRRTGWYFSVSREGQIGPGDSIERLSRDPHGLAITDVTRIYVEDRGNMDLLHRALAVPALPASWRDYFQECLDRYTR
ncbi:MAG TPA: MOSC domain-containing protein [Ktedonobacterales bacterium]|nr:MOSC domain-containing protein [Ktedonobacterales bacterium]